MFYILFNEYNFQFAMKHYVLDTECVHTYKTLLHKSFFYVPAPTPMFRMFQRDQFVKMVLSTGWPDNINAYKGYIWMFGKLPFKNINLIELHIIPITLSDVLKRGYDYACTVSQHLYVYCFNNLMTIVTDL